MEWKELETLKIKTETELKNKLFEAVRDNNISEVEKALSLRADVNSADNDDWTLLICACWRGYTDIVKLLIKHGADVNLIDCDGNTALINACWNGHIDIAKLLIEYGADINIRYRSGQTALDILKEKYPAKYKRWMEQNIKKQRETKLRLEDSTDRQNIQPDWNI